MLIAYFIENEVAPKRLCWWGIHLIILFIQPTSSLCVFYNKSITVTYFLLTSFVLMIDDVMASGDGSVMENYVVTIRKRGRGTKHEEIVMRGLN